MNEFEKKLSEVLDTFNATFTLNVSMTGNDQPAEEQTSSKKGKRKAAKAEVKAEKTETAEEQMVTKVTIAKLQDGVDGSEFVEQFCALFGPLVEQMSNGTKAMVYEEGRGLAIRRVDED